MRPETITDSRGEGYKPPVSQMDTHLPEWMSTARLAKATWYNEMLGMVDGLGVKAGGEG